MAKKNVIKRLTKASFDNAVDSLNQTGGRKWDPKNIRAAEKVLVEGKKHTFVVESEDIPASTLFTVCQRIVDEHKQAHPIPDGWVEDIVELPTKELEALEKKYAALEKTAIKALAKSQKETDRQE